MKNLKYFLVLLSIPFHTVFAQSVGGVYGWVNGLPKGDNFAREITWSAGVEYFLSRNFSLMGNYHNRCGAGGGLSVRF